MRANTSATMLATQWTIEEYERAVEDGSFHREWGDRRIELLFGELCEIPVIGPRHASCLVWLTEWSINQIRRDRASIRTRSQIRIPDFDSEPEPGESWIKLGDYRKRHPSASDLHLIIEVAEQETWVAERLSHKLRLYALAGIPDVWLVHIPGHLVEVFRSPRRGHYTEREFFGPDSAIHPLAFPEVTLRTTDLFDEMGMESGPQWFSVRCLFRTVPKHAELRFVYEERIVVLRAFDLDDAIRRAEQEAKKYAPAAGTSTRYTGYSMAYAFDADDRIGDATEVFSLLRDSDLDLDDYLDRFHDTGNEYCRTMEEQPNSKAL